MLGEKRGRFAKLETRPLKDSGLRATKLRILGDQNPESEYVLGAAC